MSSVSSLNPGVADLLQTLTNLNSPVLSSQSVTKALEKAPPGDIVQLSNAATQLEGMDAMFGVTPGASTDLSSTLLASPTTQSALSTASPTDKLANAQAAIQAELTQGLFGTGTTNSLSGTLFNTLG